MFRNGFSLNLMMVQYIVTSLRLKGTVPNLFDDAHYSQTSLKELTPQTVTENRPPIFMSVSWHSLFKGISCLHFISVISLSLPILVMLQVRGYSRDELELGCGFLGLVVLHNKVKPQTAPALVTLHNAHLTTVMVTGMHNQLLFPQCSLGCWGFS